MSEPTPIRPQAPLTQADLAEHEERETLELQSLPGRVAGRIFRRGALVVIGSLVLGGIGALGGVALAQSAIDGGAAKAVAPALDRVSKAEARLDKIEPTLQQIALEQVRVSTGVDMLLRAQGLTPPPKVLPDGGP